jgi:hypothetical protein
MHRHTSMNVGMHECMRSDTESEFSSDSFHLYGRGETQSHTHTSIHIKVRTSSATCFGKRRAAPTLFPSTKDPGNHLVWGRSLRARAAHRRSRRWRCSSQRPLSTGTWQHHFRFLRCWSSSSKIRFPYTWADSHQDQRTYGEEVRQGVCWSQCACTKKNACIEEKQRVRQPAVRYIHQNKQKQNKYIHTRRHASTQVDMYHYDYMRRVRKGHQLSSILRKANKQTCMHVCLCIYTVCAGTISLISLLCLFVCRCTLWHKNTNTQSKNTGQYISRNDWKSKLSLKLTISTQQQETHTLTEDMITRQKRTVAGPTTGCCANKESCTEEKQRIRQPAVRYTEQNKTKKPTYTCTDTQEWMLVCMLYVNRQRIRVGQPAVRYTQKSKQTSMHACVRWHVCLKHSMSVPSHAKHAHSLKGWKPGKNVRWQGRQLVVVQMNNPVSRRNRELGIQL